jgi:tRNA pseudouridine38-40 synthase
VSKFALKLGYLSDSNNFSGFSHQLLDPTNIYTVVRKALSKARLMEDDKEVKYASRTDRGVGAISQVISIKSSNAPIIPEINSYLPTSIRILGLAQVPLAFNPRKDALQRTYSYFLTINNKSFDIEQAKEVVSALIGTHDFGNFAKLEPHRSKNTIKTITNASLTQISHNIIQIQISSRSFLWQQIRRIIGHLTKVATTELTPNHTQNLLSGELVNKKPPPAPPEPLLLEKITYKTVQFITDKKGVKSFRDQLHTNIQQYESQLALSQYMTKSLNNGKTHISRKRK